MKNEPTRRAVLKGLAATGAVLGTPNIASAAKSKIEEDSPELQEFLAEVRAVGADLLLHEAALDGNSRDKALNTVLDHTIDPPWDVLKGSRLDPIVIENKSVMLAVIRGEMGVKISRMKTLEDMRIVAEANQGNAIYAQGIPVASSLVIANKHVTRGLIEAGGDVMTVREHPVYDLAFALIPGANFSKKEMLRYPIPLANEDVHGGFVVFSGINPNRTSHDTGASVTGKKLLGGIAVRTPESFIPLLSEKSIPTAAELKRYRNSFLVEIPNSESLGIHGEMIPIKRATFKGSSTSPVSVLRNGKYEFCGVVDSVLRIPLRDGTFRTFAVFHGPEAVNTTAKDLSQY
ncbi:twin-arginine translocation signal domain-containing protein [Candidatus Kaiserbacteria bacterium]|nr:twin-arginine translocation signal domain-containing protein [Candidatus Kaiserbacteria bacterium]